MEETGSITSHSSQPGQHTEGSFREMDENPVLQLKKLHIYKVVGAIKERPVCCEERCPRLCRRVLLNSGRAGISSLEEELESSEQ